MRDSDIRTALVEHELARHVDAPDTLVRHELGIGAGRNRIDVAVVNGRFAGWEIKSDVDTIRRLGGQVESYSKVLDRAHLVTTARWIGPAVDHVPSWWGVLCARHTRVGIRLDVARPAAPNPGCLDPFSLAQLLWRDEALAELRRLGAARGLSGRARHYVWERLVETLTLGELRALVRSTLKARPSW